MHVAVPAILRRPVGGLVVFLFFLFCCGGRLVLIFIDKRRMRVGVEQAECQLTRKLGLMNTTLKVQQNMDRGQ